MAGDWIKMRTGIRRHPKVIAMSRHLAADRAFMDWWSDPVRKTCRDNVTECVTFEVVTRVTVCGLLEVWGAVNTADKGDGHLPYMEVIDIDDIAGIPGFGDAMLAVGWLREADEDELQGVVFPNFSEFNTPDSRRKGAKSDAQRAREYRARKKAQEEEKEQRHERHETSRREEKRREEKDISARGSALAKPEFLEEQIWNDFRSYRTSKRAKLTSTAWTRIVAELERGIARGHDPNDMLGEAMEAGWTGFKVEWYENRKGQTKSAAEHNGPLGKVLE